MKPHYLLLLTIIVLSSCGTSTRFAARKYTKGYFVDVAGALPTVASRGVKHSVTKPVVAPAKKVTVPVQQVVVSSPKPLEKHPSLTVAKSTRKIVKVLSAVMPSPIVNVVTDGGKHADDNTSATGKHSIIAGLLFLGLFVLDIIIGALRTYHSVVFILGLLAAAILVVSVVNAFISLKHHEKYYGISVAILILVGLAILGTILSLFAVTGP